MLRGQKRGNGRKRDGATCQHALDPAGDEVDRSADEDIDKVMSGLLTLNAPEVTLHTGTWNPIDACFDSNRPPCVETIAVKR